MAKNISLRESFQTLAPYSSARSEVQENKDLVFLDANENWQSPILGMNRYPDPLQNELREKLAGFRGLKSESVLLTNGSDEGIDLLVRSFCEPGKDSVLITPPTFSMFSFAAKLNGTGILEVPLRTGFQLDLAAMKAQKAKVAFLCSPGNPTALALRKDDILEFARAFSGIVVVDEAYVDFCPDKSVLQEVYAVPNLIVLQTFSKAWGLAGIRLGALYANTEIISALQRVKMPYNVNRITAKIALDALQEPEFLKESVAQVLAEREKLCREVQALSFVKRVFPTDANFFLFHVEEPKELQSFLLSQGLVLRDRSQLLGCKGCLRVTVGSPEENERLVSALKIYGESL